MQLELLHAGIIVHDSCYDIYTWHLSFYICGSWTESTFRFLVEQWKDHLPSGYLLKEAYVDQPSEEDACHCHFTFVQDGELCSDTQLVLNYQWFVGERMLSNFAAIPDATGVVMDFYIVISIFESLLMLLCLYNAAWCDGQVYWPKHEDIDKILKVECTPLLGETKYPSIFAISSRVSPGILFPCFLWDWNQTWIFLMYVSWRVMWNL